MPPVILPFIYLPLPHIVGWTVYLALCVALYFIVDRIDENTTVEKAGRG